MSCSDLFLDSGSFLLCVMISTYLRPTCASLWFPFLISFASSERKWLISFNSFNAFLKWQVYWIFWFLLCINNNCFEYSSFIVLGVAISFDSWWYGAFTLVPLQFLMFNFVNNFSLFYGWHPWHWYFTNALPSLMGPTLVPILMSVICAVRCNNVKQQLNEKGSSFISLIKISTITYIISHRY
jgi:phosphatidylinositol glycan class B